MSDYTTKLDQVYADAYATVKREEPWLQDELIQERAAGATRLFWFNTEVQRLLDATGNPLKYQTEIYDRFCAFGLHEQRLQNLAVRLRALDLISPAEYDKTVFTQPLPTAQRHAQEADYRERERLKAWIFDILDHVENRDVALKIYSSMGDDSRSHDKLSKFTENLKRAGQLPLTYSFQRQAERAVGAVKEAGQRLLSGWEGDQR